MGEDTTLEAVWTTNMLMAGVLGVSEEELPIQLPEDFDEVDFDKYLTQLK